MSAPRRYQSPKRQEQAEATRARIVAAFAQQLSESGRDSLSPTEAAEHAGVSLRTVHFHFPDEASRVAALGQWFDSVLYPRGIVLVEGPDDLPRYFSDIHRQALKHPVSRVLASGTGVWREMRAVRRAARLDAIRSAVKAIGAPSRPTADATAMLLSLSGADASWTMHDHGLPLRRIPDVIANTVELILDQLREQVVRR